MDYEPHRLMKRLYGLLILLGVLQVAAVALLIYFAGESFKREQSLLDRAAEMTEVALPGIKQDVLDVSRKATEIKGDISGLRTQVSSLDERVGEVRSGVSSVGRQVESLDENVTGFVQDKGGLIWGHSLNPYLLLALLALLLASFPLWGYLISRRSLDHKERFEELLPGPPDAFCNKLDKLAVVLESIRQEQEGAEPPGPDLEMLMQQTERLISEARTELAHLAWQSKPVTQEPEITPDKLH